MTNSHNSHRNFLSFALFHLCLPLQAEVTHRTRQTVPVIPAFMTAPKYAWKISPNLDKSKLSMSFQERKLMMKGNVQQIISTLRYWHTQSLVCIQQEASIAAVWQENSRKWTLLQNLRRYGRRQVIPITHSHDLHSSGLTCTQLRLDVNEPIFYFDHDAVRSKCAHMIDFFFFFFFSKVNR